MYKMHHPKTNVDRMCVKRREGDSGLLRIEATIKKRQSILQNTVIPRLTSDTADEFFG
jgi:hypothetical protein